jgi:hypothetical protein
MLRTMLESLISPRAKSIRFELSPDLLPDLEQYYDHTFFYRMLLQFNSMFILYSRYWSRILTFSAPGCVHEVSDLSQLWFREFFLELSMGEAVQVCVP